MRQSPLQCNHLAVAFTVGVARSPRLIAHGVGLLHIRSHRTWGETILHGKRIEERLYCRTHLATTARNHIVHKMCVVESAYVCLHRSRLRIHTHKASTQIRLHIAYAVYRCHHGVDIAMIGEESHLCRRMERAVNFFIACARSFQCSIAFALKHSTFHNLVNLFLCQCGGKRSVRFALLLLEELRLQVASHMSINCLFGIALHTRVDGGVHLQAVGIEIVRRAVLLAIFVAPSVERIVHPCN